MLKWGCRQNFATLDYSVHFSAARGQTKLTVMQMTTPLSDGSTKHLYSTVEPQVLPQKKYNSAKDGRIRFGDTIY
jgi:hypothetical protein